ncbi:MOSC domain-containing protein [Sphingomonas sp. ID0503]|uniref:MOSC domain-containing protein n=1 Tax=Sphingomonas sp. ID0503 TaxID=3399691 RepID=UPI003AFA145D
MTKTGILLGIARHARPKGPMEVLDRAFVGLDTGVEGDFRGAIKPGGRGRRQVTLMTLADWQIATRLVGAALEWQHRRVNLLVDGLVLPREEGGLIRIGARCTLRITGECDPCRRMNALVDGLELALRPDWRGGRTSKVIAADEIVVGDAVVAL